MIETRLFDKDNQKWFSFLPFYFFFFVLSSPLRHAILRWDSCHPPECLSAS